MPETLKPCPFCGGKAEVKSIEYIGLLEYFVICSRCEVRTSEYLYEKNAIASWNIRERKEVNL